MPIETICQGCGQTLRVADEHAGKKARCPKCQAINAIPVPGGSDPYAPRPLADSYSPTGGTFSSSPAPSSSPATASTPQELWTMQIDDGRTFGPVPRAELDKWFGEGRVTPACKLMSSRDNRWRPAGEIYPSLGIAGVMPAGSPAIPSPLAGNNPFSDRTATMNPYAVSGAPGRTWTQPHNGVLILVFGLLGLFFCQIFSVIAVFLGHTSLSEIKAGRMDPEGHGLVVGGLVLGYIGTVLLVLSCGCVGLSILAGGLN